MSTMRAPYLYVVLFVASAACAADRSHVDSHDAGDASQPDASTELDATHEDAFMDAMSLDALVEPDAFVETDASSDVDAGAPTTWLLPDEFVGVPLSGTYDCDRSVSNDYRCGGDPSYGTGEGEAPFSITLNRTADGYTAELPEFYAVVYVSTGGPSSVLFPSETISVAFDTEAPAEDPRGIGSVETTSALGANPYFHDSAAVLVRSTGIVVSHLYRTDTLACNEIIDSTSCTARWSLP